MNKITFQSGIQITRDRTFMLSDGFWSWMKCFTKRYSVSENSLEEVLLWDNFFWYKRNGYCYTISNAFNLSKGEKAILVGKKGWNNTIYKLYFLNENLLVKLYKLSSIDQRKHRNNKFLKFKFSTGRYFGTVLLTLSKMYELIGPNLS